MLYNMQIYMYMYHNQWWLENDSFIEYLWEKVQHLNNVAKNDAQ